MTQEQKSAIMKRRLSGLGYATIAKEIGLSKDAVVAFCRRNGLRKYCSHACYIRDRFQGGGADD